MAEPVEATAVSVAGSLRQAQGPPSTLRHFDKLSAGRLSAGKLRDRSSRCRRLGRVSSPSLPNAITAIEKSPRASRVQEPGVEREQHHAAGKEKDQETRRSSGQPFHLAAKKGAIVRTPGDAIPWFHQHRDEALDAQNLAPQVLAQWADQGLTFRIQRVRSTTPRML